jgi:hydroxymethylglutaryl-CoA lyase
VVERAVGAGVPVEAILATSFGCPYEGRIEPAAVAAVAARLRDRGVSTFSFADTTGMATPPTVVALLDELAGGGWPADRVALHLHDTRGTGLANLVVAAQRGVARFDASVGASAAARSPPVPPATCPPRTWSTSSTRSAWPPGSTWSASSRWRWTSRG